MIGCTHCDKRFTPTEFAQHVASVAREEADRG